MCLFFYFQNMFPSDGDIAWTIGTPAFIQINNMIRILGSDFTGKVWGYFKEFQKMHEKERISSKIVNKYKDTICFMVGTNTCRMEAVDPRTSWVMPMGYEVF